jgi:hypothetical protein
MVPKNLQTILSTKDQPNQTQELLEEDLRKKKKAL